jgi:large-conductance mechanosensitive channel
LEGNHGQGMSAWRVAWAFIVESLVAVIIFVVIASVAVGLSLTTKALTARQIDGYIVLGLQLTEYVLFTLDLLLFNYFMIVNSIRTLRRL